MITIDGHTLKEFGMFALQGHDHPLTPAFAERTLFIPNRPGLIHFGTTPRDRQFTIPVGIIEYDKLIKQQKIRDLVNILFDAYGNPKEVKLTFDYDPDKFYKVKVNERLNFERLVHAGEAELVFTAYDPFSYATMNQYDTEALYGEVGEDDYYNNPQAFEWVYSAHYSAVYNHSHYNTPFIIEIDGTVTNPKITNMTTNKTLTLPSISNGKIEINSERFSIKKDNGNGLPSSNGNFFDITSGDVEFKFEGDNPNATVTYKWLHKFM